MQLVIRSKSPEMAVQKITFGVGLLQIISSLTSIALCARHYSDTTHMHTTIKHVAVMFAVRSLPSLSLLVCGIIGTIMSCIKNKTVRVVHTTITAQTSIGIAVNIWYFSYTLNTSAIQYDVGSATRCMIAAICCLIVCLTYLLYLLIQLCRHGLGDSSMSEMSEKTQISDIESAASSSGVSSFSAGSYHSTTKLQPTKLVPTKM